MTAILSIFLFGLLPPFFANAETFALIIGVNQYNETTKFSQLRGAVNDAKLIHKTLVRAGVPEINITELLDQRATKSKIEASWNKMISKSKRDDTLIFSFAGHGTQEFDQNGDEKLLDPTDTLDETLLLSGYADFPRKANNERLVDDELYTLWKRANGRRIIFIVDSCHSGGATRSGDFRARKSAWISRAAPASQVTLSKPSIIDTKRNKEIDIENFFLFAATESRKQSLEGIIEGVHHGALSWAFAQAIEYSISHHQSNITYTDLRNYVENEVRNRTDSRQFTDIRPRGSGNEVLFTLKGNPIRKRITSKQPIIRVNIIGKTPNWFHNLSNVQINKKIPDFIWDIPNGEIINKQGDITAFRIKSRDDFSQIINRIRLIQNIDQLAKRHNIKSQLSPYGSKNKNSHAKLHKFSNCKNCDQCKDQCIAFSISDIKEISYLYQFNITGNGLIQCFEPERVQQKKDYEFNATPPAGNDTLVTILVPKENKDLSQLITEKKCQSTSYIMKKLPSILKNVKYKLGRIDTFTGK